MIINRCERAADTALEPGLIPFWPFGVLQRYRRCRTVSLSDEARPLLLRVQEYLLSSAPNENDQGLAGAGVGAAQRKRRPRVPWARQLKRGEVVEVLRRLCFPLLGPLWEEAQQPSDCWSKEASGWTLLDEWTPGCLPPAVAAPTLLAAVTFLAAEGGTRLIGVSWEPLVLLNGENSKIDGETLPWHLTATDANLARRLFSAVLEPFGLLLGALCGSGRALATTREDNRRRYGIGGGMREARLTARDRANETEMAREAREGRERYSPPPTERFAFSRLIPEAPVPPRPRECFERALIGALVLAAQGTDPDNCDIMHRFGVTRTLMESRYVRYWVLRHIDHDTQHLATTLADALDLARATNRSLLLPEWPPVPPPAARLTPPRRLSTPRARSPRAARRPPPAA